jgi:hypothetical protein
MLVVVGAMLVVTMIPVMVFTTANGQVPLVLQAQARAEAVAAARAGLTAYFAQLDANPSYAWQYNEEDDYTWHQQRASDPAFTTWVPVTGASNEHYTYRVRIEGTSGASLLVVGCGGPLASPTSTCVGQGLVPVALAVSLKSESLFANAYVTKHNIEDPADPNLYLGLSGYTPEVLAQIKDLVVPPNSDQTTCWPQTCPPSSLPVDPNGCVVLGNQQNPAFSLNGQPFYGAEPSTPEDFTIHVTVNHTTYGVSCIPSYWQDEQVHGSVFSDDTFYACGQPSLSGPVETYSAMTPSNNGGTGWAELPNQVWYLWNLTMSSCGYPRLTAQPGPYHELPSLADLQRAARSGGCYYTGQTSIVVDGQTMAVSSPNSLPRSRGGQTPDACLGQHAKLPGNGVIYVANTTGLNCQPALGPPPPVGWGPPTFRMGLQQGQFVFGFTGTWEPPEPPSGGLTWQTEDGACAGDLFVQGTLAASTTFAAANNVYLTGSLCVAGDTTCEKTNNTGIAGQGNDLSLPTPPTVSIPSSSTVLIGVVAGNLVKAYDPSAQATFDLNPLDWHWRVNCSLQSLLQGTCELVVKTPFSGEWQTETGLEGYPHRNVIVDGVLLDLEGGLTTQNIIDAASAGATPELMSDPNPFDHVGKSYPGLQNFGVEGSMVSDFAPNMDCNVVAVLGFDLTGCETPVDLEIPLPYATLTGGCPNYPSSRPPADQSGNWGFHQVLAFSFFFLNVCVGWYWNQVVISSHHGYTASYASDARLAVGSPPFLPPPVLEPRTVSGVAPSAVASWSESNLW